MSFIGAYYAIIRGNRGEAVESLASYVAADPGDRYSRLALAENYRQDGPSRRRGVSHRRSRRATTPRRSSFRPDRARSPGPGRGRSAACSGPCDDPLWPGSAGGWRCRAREARRCWPTSGSHTPHDPENRETIFGLSAALELSGDKKASLALREAAGNLDRLSSLIHARPFRPRGTTQASCGSRGGLRGPGPKGRSPCLVQAGHRLRSA